MDENISTELIVRFAVLTVIGVVIMSAVVMSTPSSTTTRFTFTDNPSDGDTISMDGQVLEFDSGNGVTSGHTPVTIGTDLNGTVDNFTSAVSAHYEVVT